MLEKDRVIKFLLENGFEEIEDGFYERHNTAFSIVTVDPVLTYKIICDGVYINNDALYCCIDMYETHVVELENLKYLIVKDVSYDEFIKARDELIAEVYK